MSTSCTLGHQVTPAYTGQWQALACKRWDSLLNNTVINVSLSISTSIKQHVTWLLSISPANNLHPCLKCLLKAVGSRTVIYQEQTIRLKYIFHYFLLSLWLLSTPFVESNTTALTWVAFSGPNCPGKDNALQAECLQTWQWIKMRGPLSLSGVAGLHYINVVSTVQPVNNGYF